jgi:hypothetical protein
VAFKKAQSSQAYFKSGAYGKQGSGKTFTSLLWGEYLANLTGKRMAVVDTEHGTDFYASRVKERRIHPEAFDFDAIYTRSIMEVVDEISALDPNVYSVLILDSITHLWEAARNAYSGKLMSNGGIPIQAWAKIKKPYKRLMSLILDGQFHCIICGREGVVMEEDENGEPQVVGKKMKAEGETGYEPNFLFQFKPRWLEDGTQQVSAFVEKDRSGILQYKTLIEPKPADIEPLIKYLCGEVQPQVSEGDSAERDAARIDALEQQEAEERRALFGQIKNAITHARNQTELKAAWALTSGKKNKLGDEFFSQLETAKNARKVEFLQEAA